MSSQSVPLRTPEPRRQRPELVQFPPKPAPLTALRAGFWAFGIVLAAMQAWALRYYVSADAISYLDMSDGVMPGGDWHRLINGVWSPLYPFLLGSFRRTFHISPVNEIVAGHLLNLAFFIFAFACFEFLLRAAINDLSKKSPNSPAWIYTATAYSLFLWASIGKITLTSLRADMLMSGFVYLAVALLFRMKGRPATWSSYCLLGVVLGIGILAKQFMLPLGLVILSASFFAVRDWRPALKMVAVSLLIFLALGSLYFVPLSLSRGRFSLGESGVFNYLVYLDQARPMWYLQDPGAASGQFVHSPQKIYSSPSAYAFTHSSLVTHPVRFDPSDWIAGVRPRVVLLAQLQVCLQNVRKLARFLPELAPALLLIVALAALFWEQKSLPALQNTWPIWFAGLMGCAMYVPLHIEPRYVGAFVALFFMGVIFSLAVLSFWHRRLLVAAGLVAVLGLCVPMLFTNGVKYFASLRTRNADAEAATELAKGGILPGDRVARISPTVTDLGIERIARVEVVAEVGIGDSQKFWDSVPGTQSEILRLFTLHGAKAVIATIPDPTPQTPLGFRQLGSSRYWIWLPNSATGAASRRPSTKD